MASQIVCATTLVSMAGCMGQVSPESCASEYIHHTVSTPIDLGNGVTVQEQNHAGYFNPSDHWGAERLVVRDCTSGQWARLEKSAQDESGADVHDHRAAVDKMLEKAMKLPGDEAIRFLAVESKKMGILLGSGAATTDDCACQTLYPELGSNTTNGEVEQ